MMDSRKSQAPLTLLLGKTAAEITFKLQSLLASDDGFSLSHKASPNGRSFDIIYQGISLRLMNNPQAYDVTGLKRIFCNLDTKSAQSSLDIHLGEHVAGGERVPAIVQGLLGAGQKLGLALDAIGAVWHPANIVSGFDYFSEAVSDYLAGGAFPVLALVNFKTVADSDIDSFGLAHLSGQELRVAGHDMDQSDLMRRVVRVVHDIAVNGPMLEAVRLDGIEPGETIDLQPAANAEVLNMTVYSIRDA